MTNNEGKLPSIEDTPNMSFRNIGRELGIAESVVQQIFEVAIAKLRRQSQTGPIQNMLELSGARRTMRDAPAISLALARG